MHWRTDILIIAILLLTYFTTIDGISLDCSYEMVTWVILGSAYTCTGSVRLDGSVNENVTAVFGNHQTGKGNDDVHAINLSSQKLEFFPTNIENFFPNINVIILDSNRIITVSNRHLIPFPNLQVLALYQNEIVSIDSDLFSGMDSMRWISFASNDLRHVGHDLNIPINSEIYFTTNTCISQSATSPDAISGLKFNLLRNCPPTLSQIEHSLEKRQNFLTRIDGQVQRIIETNEELNVEIATIRNETNNQLAAQRNQMNDELAKQRNDTNNELAALLNQMNQLFNELATKLDETSNELATLRSEKNEELATLRNQMIDELQTLRSEKNDELATLRDEQANLWHVMYDFNRRIENLENNNKTKYPIKF